MPTENNPATLVHQQLDLVYHEIDILVNYFNQTKENLGKYQRIVNQVDRLLARMDALCGQTELPNNFENRGKFKSYKEKCQTLGLDATGKVTELVNKGVK